MWHSPKHATHNGPWLGILYYNLTTPNRGGSLIHQPGTHTAALWIRSLGIFTSTLHLNQRTDNTMAKKKRQDKQRFTKQNTEN